MQLEIITPEAKVLEAQVDAVQMPGKDGLFQVLADHAPMISTLSEGTVKIDLQDSHKKFDNLSGQIEADKSDDKVVYFKITGGVVEMQNNKLILLAD